MQTLKGRRRQLKRAYRLTTDSLRIAALFLWIVCGVEAQDVGKIVKILESEPPKLTPNEKPADEPAQPALMRPVFHLADGSKIIGTPRFEALEIKTRYGVLSIPQSELLRVRFAARLEGEHEHPTTQRKAGLIQRLTGSEDECRTHRMTIRGRVLAEEFRVDTQYGDLAVLTRDLTAIVIQAKGSVSKNVKVLPSYQAPHSWFDSGIDVQKDDLLRIQASGLVRVNSYGVSSGPAGTREYSTSNTFMRLPMLALVAKIGKKGKPFAVGNTLKQDAKGAGRLFFSVVPFTYNPGDVNGSYDAKIDVIREP